MSDNKIPPVNILFNGKDGDTYHYAAFISFPYNPTIRDLEQAGRSATVALQDHLPNMKVELDDNGYDYRYSVSVGPYGRAVVLTAYGSRVDKEGETHITSVTPQD